MSLLFAVIGVLVFGGSLAAALSRWPRAASFAGALSAVVGCTLGCVLAARGLAGEALHASFAWNVPSGGIVLACDALSAFFLLPLFVLGGLAAIYGHDDLLAHRGDKVLGPPWLAFDLLLASMAIVVTARHAVLFLVAWEVMSLSSFVLVTFDHEDSEVKRAGLVYLIAAHVGTALLVAMFLLLGSATGSLVFGEGRGPLGGPGLAILLLAIAGFGVKAGLVPLHVWLPEAHAAAPSHVSALMSGVMTKMGVYGILRVASMADPLPAWWGRALVVVGLGGALFGAAIACYQRDIKRVLAYSTIENVGLVVLGLGLGFWGRATGHPLIGALGFAGGMMHAWNHTIMKGLLFLGGGAIAHAAGTKDLERLGGLLRRAPIAASLFFAGALAISGLPPLNGFAGEWLLYRSLLEGSISGAPSSAIAFMLAVGALSAASALAALCFVRVSGVALLGEPRSDGARRAHEASPRMRLAMGALFALMVAMGARPSLVAAASRAAAQQIAGSGGSAGGAVSGALAPIERAAHALLGVGLVTAMLLLVARRRAAAGAGERPTWDCGYAAPSARMQYTGRAFAGMLVDLLPRPLAARTEITKPSGLFPAAGEVRSRFDDPVTRGAYEPAIETAADRFARLRWLQQGAVHVYLLYILVAVVAGLTWTSMEGWGSG